jgi:hypothetical protein
VPAECLRASFGEEALSQITLITLAVRPVRQTPDLLTVGRYHIPIRMALVLDRKIALPFATTQDECCSASSYCCAALMPCDFVSR